MAGDDRRCLLIRFRVTSPRVSVRRSAVVLAARLPSAPIVTSLVVLFVLMISVAGCNVSKLFGHGSEPGGHRFPLVVELRLDSSITAAALEYIDACRQRQTLHLGDRLKNAFVHEMSSIFERVQVAPNGSRHEVTDGAVEITLGLNEINLFIPRQETSLHPAIVTLEATAVYKDSVGAVLYTKRLQVQAHGKVGIEEQKCEVHGLAPLASQAVAILSRGLKKHLSTSTKVREAAGYEKGGAKVAASKADLHDQQMAGNLLADRALNASPTEQVSLAFRVMLKDMNENQRIESGEILSAEVEISNAGPGIAKDVVIRIDGAPVLVQQFPSLIAVGDLQPSETKRVGVSAKGPVVDTGQQAELLFSLETDSFVAAPPDQKQFLVVLHPQQATEFETGSDVDRIPSHVLGNERQKAVGIAIGVGAFRTSDVSDVRFAVHDAEVMARYFRTVVGIQSDRIKLITNEHVLKGDLIDLFEDWLPRQVEAGGEVFIFVAGRALHMPSTGSISLIPYEAGAATPKRLFSLRRLYDALARLPIQRAVLLLDLAFTESSSPARRDGQESIWSTIPASLQGGKLVQIIGVSGRREAHQYEDGQHGLFTYYLLKGLRGAADKDQNGQVSVGELCGYVRARIRDAAEEKLQNAQELICLPPLDTNPELSVFSLGRVK